MADDSAQTVTKQDGRFEIAVDGETAGRAAFVDRDGRRIFFHTEVGDAWSGKGLARTLVAQALDATRDEGLQIVPVCSYVEHLVEKDDSWSDQVVEPTAEDREAVPAPG